MIDIIIFPSFWNSKEKCNNHGLVEFWTNYRYIDNWILCANHFFREVSRKNFLCLVSNLLCVFDNSEISVGFRTFSPPPPRSDHDNMLKGTKIRIIEAISQNFMFVFSNEKKNQTCFYKRLKRVFKRISESQNPMTHPSLTAQKYMSIYM